MSNRNFFKSRKLFQKEQIFLSAILLLACGARLIGLSGLPDGVLPDEAYGAYNAYSIMQEGIDSRGYAFPAYFVAWGSGMSVLYSYLAIPFMKLFGTGIAIYRLPQAIVGIAGVYAAYVLGKELVNVKFACLLSFVLAINPWHIMNTRFGLDANMAPGMFLIALCFLVLGLKKNNWYLIPSAIFMGATMYCYVLSWIMIPIFLLIGFIVYWKRIPRKLPTFLFVGLLFVLALPLLLFVGINIGLLPEIRTPFLSIPKLPGFRGKELDISHIYGSIKDLARIVLFQFDGVAYTSSKLTGAYYFFTTPFMLVGIICHLITFVKNFKNGRNDLEFVFLIWLISACVMSILNENITTIHINLVHIPLIFYGAYGIYRTGQLLHNEKLVPVCVAFFAFSFCVFFYDYASTPTTYFFDEKTDEAIETAKEMAGDGTVTILGYPTIKYSNLLWHEKPSAGDFYQNAVYVGDPAWAELDTYGRFRYVTGAENVDRNSVCIASYGDVEALSDNGFEIIHLNDRYVLAVDEK